MPLNRFTHINLMLVAICSLFYCSCNKIGGPDIEYTVEGIRDVSISENGNVRLNLSISPQSSKSELLTLSIEGLPTGVSYSFNNTVGEPPFDTELYIKDDSSRGGTYHVRLVCLSASGQKQTFNFKLTTSQKACSKKLVGIFHANTFCRNNKGDILGNVEITVDSNDINKLYFTWGGETVELIINCNRDQVTLPSQTLNEYKIEGNGYIHENYTIINFDYTEFHTSGDTVTCNMHMIKQ